MAAMFVNGSGQTQQSLQSTFHICFLQIFGSFGKAVSEEKIFRNRPIRNKNCLWRPCLLMDRDEISNLYRGPSIDASCKVSVHLAKQFQRRRFLEIDQSEIRIACGGHVCQQIRTKCAVFIEDLPYMLPTMFQFIWHTGFRGEDFFINQPIRNKNCLWRPCLLMNRDEISNQYRGPSIDASYQFWVIWQSGFRGEDFQKSTNQKQELPVVAMFVNGSGQTE